MTAQDTTIYFDHASTTPCDQRVVDAMLPYFTSIYGNSSSRNHAYGWEAENGVDTADHKSPIFWGPAEGNHFHFGGHRIEQHRHQGRGSDVRQGPRWLEHRGHIITAVHEHKAVIDPCRRLEREGFDVTFLEPGSDGIITAQMVKDALRDDTILVSIMWANNELGTINEIPCIGKICKEHGAVFHTDATQWVGKLPTDVEADNIDLLSLSAHKMYGPKGVGALYVRRRRPRVRLEAIQDGGGHERGFRSGTLNVSSIVGLGAACAIAKQEMEAEGERLRGLRDKLENELMSRLEVVEVNGHREHRLPHMTNISFGFVEGESLMMGIKNIACSSGSACTSASLEPSYVLKALGVGDELAHSSLRLSLGRHTTEAEVDEAIEGIAAAVEHLRAMRPLFDLWKEGVDISKIEWQSH